MNRTNVLLIAVGMLTCICSVTRGDIIINGNVDSGTGELVITSDIEFSILTPSSGFRMIVLDEWTSYDGVNSQSSISPHIDIEVDGLSTTSNAFIVEGGVSQNDATPNDGRIQMSSQTASTNFILESGTYSLAPSSGGWNTGLESGFRFTGNIFLTDSSFNRVSSIESVASSAAVPEPCSFILYSICIGLILGWRSLC